jgi:hypothetical protein
MEDKLEKANVSKDQYLEGRNRIGIVGMAISHIMEQYDTISYLQRAVDLRQKWYNEILLENTKLKREIQEHENGGPAKLPSVKPKKIDF